MRLAWAPAGGCLMGFAGRVALAALCGAVIAWAATALVLHAAFAAVGYTREALVELPPRAVGAVGGCGALLGVATAWLGGSSPLPGWVRPAVLDWLRPAEYNRRPWPLDRIDQLGEAVIRTRADEEFRLRFYWTGHIPVAFTADGAAQFCGTWLDSGGRGVDG